MFKSNKNYETPRCVISFILLSTLFSNTLYLRSFDSTYRYTRAIYFTGLEALQDQTSRDLLPKAALSNYDLTNSTYAVTFSKILFIFLLDASNLSYGEG